MLKLVYEDNTKGFNKTELLESIHLKHHGKGYLIIKKLSEGVFLNKAGNKIKIFLRTKNGH
jgi:hypothetical protein